MFAPLSDGPSWWGLGQHHSSSFTCNQITSDLQPPGQTGPAALDLNAALSSRQASPACLPTARPPPPHVHTHTLARTQMQILQKCSCRASHGSEGSSETLSIIFIVAGFLSFPTLNERRINLFLFMSDSPLTEGPSNDLKGKSRIF